MKIDVLRVSIEVVMLAAACCVSACAGATSDDGDPPPASGAHDGGVKYANDGGSSPQGDAAQGLADGPQDTGGGGALGDAPPTYDAAQPPQSGVCAKNADCTHFQADAGAGGDVVEFCLLES